MGLCCRGVTGERVGTTPVQVMGAEMGGGIELAGDAGQTRRGSLGQELGLALGGDPVGA